MRTFRWGIVGCGNIARIHARAINELEGVELVGCVSRSLESAQKFAEEFGLKFYSTLDKLLEDVDIISVCTPSGSRKDIVLKACERGVHVLTEKPIEISLSAIDEMIRAAEKHNVIIGCVFQTRFGQAEQELKRLIAAGEFGRVVLGEADVRWFRSQEYYNSASWRGTWQYDGGGALINQAIHTIDLLQWYLGPVVRVFGWTKTLARNIEVEDTSVAVLEFENGALGVIKGCTSVAPGFARRLGIYGTEKSAELVAESLICYDFEFPKGKIVVAGTDDTSSDPMAFSYHNHKKQMEDFLDAIRTGRRPLVDGYEARKAVEIVRAIYKAAKESRVIELPLKEDV
jgi:predicted dehydrogenase